MKLLAVVNFPGWRLFSFNTRMHWAERSRANKPMIRMDDQREPQAVVTAPHRQRLVEITRYGPRLMDEDNLASTVIPALNAIKCKHINRSEIISDGYVYDDSPRYCRLRVFQKKGEYGCEVRVYG